jgi:hypothetical protein
MHCRVLLRNYVLLLIGVFSWLLAVSGRQPRFAHGTPAGSRQELAQLVGTFCIEDESQSTQSLSNSLLSCALQRNATRSMFEPLVLCFVCHVQVEVLNQQLSTAEEQHRAAIHQHFLL